MKPIDEMTGPELSHAFAENCLGWEAISDVTLKLPSGAYLHASDLAFHKDLSQAVRYAEPWAHGRGFLFNINSKGGVQIWRGSRLLCRSNGQGTHPYEKMASALLECCLAVAERGEDK